MSKQGGSTRIHIIVRDKSGRVIDELDVEEGKTTRTGPVLPEVPVSSLKFAENNGKLRFEHTWTW
jgi:hypothetical protein